MKMPSGFLQFHRIPENKKHGMKNQFHPVFFVSLYNRRLIIQIIVE